MVLAGGVITPVQLNIRSSALQLGHSGDGHSCNRPSADLERSGKQGAEVNGKTVVVTRVSVCQSGVLGVEQGLGCVPRGSLGGTPRSGLGRGRLKHCRDLKHIWHAAECQILLGASIHA